ncbi:MAG: protein kinase [Planctomycetes bacterium]|nr:protein kinase [Planctomycetota bacterium]
MNGNEAPRKPGAKGGPDPKRPHTPSTGELLGEEAKPWSSQASTGSNTGGDVEAGDLAGMMSVTTVPVRKLGSGGQADVLLVEHLGQLEAHKVLRVGRGREKEVFREALHTRRVVHPNIVKVFGIEKVGDVPVLRMEYVEGRDLGRVVDDEGALPVERLVPIAVQVADALAATHEREIVHHDLKPGNLILRKDGRSVVVTDFGVSAALRTGDDGSKKAGRGGTPYFMAPELHSPDGRGTPESDIWSLGVTLYFLASGIYPFPFGDTSPAEAVKKPPRDLTRTHRNVSPEFWAILRRMLRDDPSGVRYTTMRQVRDDLDACGRSVTCPDCGAAFRLESVAGMCPEPSCHGTRIAAAVEVLALRRTAETALAECSFDDAKRGFTSAAAVAKASGDEEGAPRLAKLAEAVDGLRAEHDALLAEVRDLFAKERDIDCVRRIHAARVRFSRSPALRQVRVEVRERIHGLFRGTEQLVMQSVRRQDFRAARDVLTRMDHIMGDPFARSELAHVAGDKPTDFQWLYQEVEKKELAFNSYSTRAREKIEAFDFAKAQREYTRLETEFPSEHNVRMLAALREAAQHHEAATGVPESELQAIVEDPARLLSEGEPARLAAAAEGCRALLAAFPIDTYPSFERIRRIELLAGQAAEAVRLAVRTRLEAADRARQEGVLMHEVEQLGEAQRIMGRTDLFEARERDEIEARCRTLRSQSRKVEALYTDAEAALRNNEYARAHAALAELATMVPGDYRDMAGLRADVDRLRGEVAALKEQLAKEFAEIERGRFNLDTATAALRHAEKLHALSDGVTRRTQLAEIGGVAVKLVTSQRDFLQGPGEVDDVGVVSFLRDTFVPVARSLPEARWQALCSISPELCRAICSLFETAMRRVLPGDDVTTTLTRAEALGATMTSVRPLLAAVVAPAGSSHPALGLARRVADAVEGTERREVEACAPRASALLGSLDGCCPPVTTEELRLAGETVEKARAAAARSRRLLRTVRLAGILVPTLLAVVGATWGGYIWGSSSAKAGGQRTVETTLDEFVHDPALSELVHDWMAGHDGDRGAYVARAPFIARWMSLRDDLARLADATSPPDAPTRARLERAVASGVPMLAADRRVFVESWREPLRDAFDADLGEAATASAVRALRTAIDSLTLARPGDGAGRTLRLRMGELVDDLSLAGRPAARCSESIRTLADLVGELFDASDGLLAATRTGEADAAGLLHEARVAQERRPQAAARAGVPQAACDAFAVLGAVALRAAAQEVLLAEVRRAATDASDGAAFVGRVRALMTEVTGLGTSLPSVTCPVADDVEGLVAGAVDALTSGLSDG